MLLKTDRPFPPVYVLATAQMQTRRSLPKGAKIQDDIILGLQSWRFAGSTLTSCPRLIRK